MEGNLSVIDACMGKVFNFEGDIDIDMRFYKDSYSHNDL